MNSFTIIPELNTWHTIIINVILLYFMSLNIRDPFDLWTTIFFLTVSLVACLFFYGLLS